MKKHNSLLFFLGTVCLLYWVFDFINIIIILQKPSWLLWYSSAGLLLTAIALLTENIILIYSLFSALFVMESIWCIDFLYVLLTRNHFLGLANYAFSSTFSQKDFIMTLYHPLIPLSLLVAVLKKRKIFKKGWIGASIYAILLALLSLLFVNHNDIVNCVYPVKGCQALFGSLPIYVRALAILFISIVFFYIPSSYGVVWFKRRISNMLYNKVRNWVNTP